MSKVLVVDDDRSATSGLVTLLESDGYEAVGTTSPTDALERLQHEHFDAVVTDLEMPVVHGVEVVRAAKKSSPTIVVVVVSAYAGSESAHLASAAGADWICGKPVQYQRLADELASRLRAH